MNKLSKEPINPLIGAAGVSAVPMAARVVNKVGLESNKQNYLLMHAWDLTSRASSDRRSPPESSWRSFR
jgi:Na+-transporting methylmalonyl-CoA/oxaloacetate decarboxylase beta subunit